MKKCYRKCLSLGVFVLTFTLCSAAAEYTIEKGEDFSTVTVKAATDQPSIQYLIENQQSEITLNASNGFFDKSCIKAVGSQPSPKYESFLISKHYDALVAARKGSMRWHIWVNKPGTLDLLPQISKLKRKEWEIKIAGRTKGVERSNSPLRFRIPKPGKYVCELIYLGDKPSSSKVSGVKLGGSSAASVSVIRTRWRPSAVHSKYRSSTCPSTKLWIFETQSVYESSSYSPMTTSFGYFGSTFGSDGNSGGGVNFSMWVASAKASDIPKIEMTSHLLATGSPEASFSGFGHEGSGVKIRGFEAYPHRPKSVIQALRLEIKNGYNVYYGYFYDEPTERWVLYAMGRVPVREKRPVKSLLAASFCEVPGPPQIERTGDLKRMIRRRGWFLDDEQKLHPVDKIICTSRTGDYTNKIIGSDKDGWLTMGTGGVESYPAISSHTEKAPSTKAPYLAADKVAALFKLPVDIGGSVAKDVTRTAARIEYEIKDAGESAEAILYYDTKDCMSFTSRELHNTEKKGVSDKLHSEDRTWQNSTPTQEVKTGNADFSLDGLKPKTTYYYRLFIKNTAGKVWTEEAGSFTTE